MDGIVGCLVDPSARAFIMVARILAAAPGNSAIRSTAPVQRRRARICSLTVESLEKREVLSDLSGLSRPGARAAAVESDQATGPGFVPMFNGTNLAGWSIPFNTGRAVVKNGQILLTGAKKFFLVSQQTYTNFILTADIMIPAQGRSGLEFRSSDGLNSVNGYKADVVTSDRIRAGGLWSQSRGWLARPSQRVPVVPGQWNHYEVDAIGDQIRIVVNNTVAVDTDNNLFTTGHIALQDHGTKDAVYRFKNVEIEDLGG
jgi:hypothetical protein